MEKWNIVKEEVNHYDSLNKTESNWLYRYNNIRDNFNTMTIEQLKNYANNDINTRVNSIAANRLYIMENFTIRQDYNNVVTLKLFIPSSCNANCSFCYMNDYEKNPHVDKQQFLNNFLDSITKLIVKMNGALPISLDITGNEPTFDVELLRAVLNKLRNYKYKDQLCRITLTTNGFNLDKVIDDFYGVIDYVNISVHDYSFIERKEIFGCKPLMCNDYSNIVLRLNNLGIPASAVSVIHKDIEDFDYFMSKFIGYCKTIGFTSLRFRNDVFWKDSKFDEYMQIGLDKYGVIQFEDTSDSRWCRLSDDEGFFVFFLKGVVDTSEVTKGIEYVINDDGLIYTDFYKLVLLDDYQFPVNLIFDRK